MARQKSLLKVDANSKKNEGAAEQEYGSFNMHSKWQSQPPPMCTPLKLIDETIDPAQFAAYNSIDVAAVFKMTVHAEPDLGLGLNLVRSDLWEKTSGTPSPAVHAGDAAILNDGDDIGNLKSSIYIPWLRKTKYLAVESLVQRRSSDHRGGAPQKDSSVHSVPSDVVNQSFRDVETTLPGPHQQGLEPVAEYSIVPKQGCWQQEYLQFQFGGAPVSQQALMRNPCGDPQFAALASGIIKMAPYDFSFEGREASAYVHTRRTRDDKPALKCVKLRKKPLVFRIQDKDSDVFQSSAMVLHMDDSSNMANVALIRRRVRASKTKAATTSFSKISTQSKIKFPAVVTLSQ